MRILTVGDSWTYGTNSSNPQMMSWPAQMSRKYGVNVVNLASPGSSNHRAARITVEELCRDSAYDWVIFPLVPASRTEVLCNGKWKYVWPTLWNNDKVSEVYHEFWHSWNDVQQTIMTSFWFIHAISSMVPNIYITGLSLHPDQYTKEMSWIMNYNNDNNFNSLGIPLDEFDIGISDLDRKLKSLKAIHLKNLESQPDYLTDVVANYLLDELTQQKYGYSKAELRGHPDDNGYHALCDYFATRIGLV